MSRDWFCVNDLLRRCCLTVEGAVVLFCCGCGCGCGCGGDETSSIIWGEVQHQVVIEHRENFKLRPIGMSWIKRGTSVRILLIIGASNLESCFTWWGNMYDPEEEIFKLSPRTCFFRIFWWNEDLVRVCCLEGRMRKKKEGERLEMGDARLHIPSFSSLLQGASATHLQYETRCQLFECLHRCWIRRVPIRVFDFCRCYTIHHRWSRRGVASKQPDRSSNPPQNRLIPNPSRPLILYSLTMNISYRLIQIRRTGLRVGYLVEVHLYQSTAEEFIPQPVQLDSRLKK